VLLSNLDRRLSRRYLSVTAPSVSAKYVSVSPFLQLVAFAPSERSDAADVATMTLDAIHQAIQTQSATTTRETIEFNQEAPRIVARYIDQEAKDIDTRLRQLVVSTPTESNIRSFVDHVKTVLVATRTLANPDLGEEFQFLVGESKGPLHAAVDSGFETLDGGINSELAGHVTGYSTSPQTQHELYFQAVLGYLATRYPDGHSHDCRPMTIASRDSGVSVRVVSPRRRSTPRSGIFSSPKQRDHIPRSRSESDQSQSDSDDEQVLQIRRRREKSTTPVTLKSTPVVDSEYSVLSLKPLGWEPDPSQTGNNTPRGTLKSVHRTLNLRPFSNTKPTPQSGPLNSFFANPWSLKSAPPTGPTNTTCEPLRSGETRIINRAVRQSPIKQKNPRTAPVLDVMLTLRTDYPESEARIVAAFPSISSEVNAGPISDNDYREFASRFVRTVIRVKDATEWGPAVSELQSLCKGKSATQLFNKIVDTLTIRRQPQITSFFKTIRENEWESPPPVVAWLRECSVITPNSGNKTTTKITIESDWEWGKKRLQAFADERTIDLVFDVQAKIFELQLKGNRSPVSRPLSHNRSSDVSPCQLDFGPEGSSLMTTP